MLMISSVSVYLNVYKKGVIVNKKQYFMLLWALGSVTEVLHAVGVSLSSEGFPVILIILVSAAFGISIYGFILTMGLHFAQKIDAKLLFLEENYNFKNDIVKPAIIAGVIFAGVFLANLLRSDVFLNYVHDLSSGGTFGATFGGTFEWFINKLFNSLRTDLMMLLFGLCGLVFLMKKIAKNAAVSTIMPISIGLMIIAPYVPVLYDSIIRGFSPNITFLISSLFASAQWLLIALLFWKKGLETALTCEVVIASIIYLIAPVVLFALNS
jgi:hypothetical protein